MDLECSKSNGIMQYSLRHSATTHSYQTNSTSAVYNDNIRLAGGCYATGDRNPRFVGAAY
jgi:hypothetical protein